MKLGIISDTHNHIPDAVFDLFNGVDQSIHAGDIGRENIITDLRTIAPVKAVFGNMDTFPLVSQYRRIDFFRIVNFEFCLTHIIGTHKGFGYQLFKMNKKVDVVIHGHTHRAEKTTYNNILFINPGSASQPRKVSKGSVGLLEVKNNTINFDIIYLE